MSLLKIVIYLNKIKENFIKVFNQRKIFEFVVHLYELLSPMFYFYLLRLFLSALNSVFNVLVWEYDTEGDKLYAFVTAIIYIMLLRKKYPRITIDSFVNKLFDNKISFLIGLSLSLIANSIVTMISYIPLFRKYLNELFAVGAEQIEGTNSLFYLVNIVVLMPIIEEYIFRKILFEKIRISIDARKAIVITSFVFAIIHYSNIMSSYQTS